MHVEVRAGDPRKPAVFGALRVIVTLPLGVLQVPPEANGAIRFVPEIPEKRAAAMQLASGPIVKVVLRFREAFWENPAIAKAARSDETLRDAVFLHAPDAPFPTWWTLRPLRVPVLTAWAGGPKALKLAGLSKRQLTDAAVDSLASIFDLPRSRLSGLLENVQHHDWIADPFARGAYSYVTTGGMSAKTPGRPSPTHAFLRRRSDRPLRPGQHRRRRSRQRTACGARSAQLALTGAPIAFPQSVMAKSSTKKKWSGKVTRESHALALDQGVFTWKDPERIARSLKRSAERSTQRKSKPYRSAMSMLTFYINRGGKSLPASQKKVLDRAKTELKKEFGKTAR